MPTSSGFSVSAVPQAEGALVLSLLALLSPLPAGCIYQFDLWSFPVIWLLSVLNVNSAFYFHKTLIFSPIYFNVLWAIE